MKTSLFSFIFLVLAFSAIAQSGSIGIGTTSPNSTAALDIQSTTKGVLIPRLSTIQRNAIPSPATGLLVFDNTTNSFWFRSVNSWVELVDTLSNAWKKNGTHIYSPTTGNVGVGVVNPIYKLSVNGDLALYNDAGVTGTFANLSNDFLINAKAGSLIGGTTASDMILQYQTGLGASSGRVGIGTSTPAYKLDVSGDTRTTGTFTAGSTITTSGGLAASGNISSGNNISAGGNIFANGSLTAGSANINGTLTSSGKITANAHMDLTGKLTRPLNTGNANLVPIAYGHVAGDGSILWGTGNFTIQKPTDWDGEYGITLSTGEDVSNALIMVQIVGNLTLKAATSKNDFSGYGETINANFVVGITRSDNNFWHNGAFYFVVFKL